MQTAQYLRNAIILGLITAMGPFAVDMYLPALPSIGENLAATPDMVALSLTSFMISFGICQIVFGAMSDMHGRKLPLYVGLGIFIAAGIGCALAHDINTLIVMRFLQGIGGAACIIIPRAIVRDMYSDVEEVKMMSLLMLIFSVSPLLAPISGSLIVENANWRGVFWAITALGFAGLALQTFFVKETLPPERRIKAGLSELKSTYAMLFRDRAFVGMVFIGAFAISGFFIYLGTSSFVLTNFYDFSPRQYSLAFSANALAFFAAAQLNNLLVKKHGMRALMIPAAIGFAGMTTLLALLFVLGVNHFAVMSTFLFISFGFVGIILPNITVLSLEKHGDVAGTAASLMNTVQMVIGAVAIGVSGTLINGNPTAMLTCIAACACLTLLFTILTFKRGA